MAYSQDAKDLMANAREALTAQLAEIKEADKAQAAAASSEAGPKGFSTRDLQQIARNCCFKYFTYEGETTIRYWQGNWWHWEAGVWTQTSAGALSGLIAAYATMPADADDEECRGLGMTNLPKLARDEVLLFMRPLVSLPGTQEFQTWLPAHSEAQKDVDTSGLWVNTTLGLLRCADHDRPEDIRIKTTPRYFTPCCIPRKFDPDTPSFWIKFLEEIFEGDQERIALLQEWFGYCCLPTTRFQKMMLMIGGGSNGKSVVLHVLKQMLGKENCSSASLSQLNQRFGLASTFGKLANICGDVATKYLKDPAELKSFIAGDDMEFEKKFCDAFSTQPTARVVFSLNRIPKTDDDSHGWWRRLLILPFDFSPAVEDKLLASPQSPLWPFRKELDQIFTWSLRGLLRTLNADGFSKCTASDETLQQWRLTNENVRRYHQERLTFEPHLDYSTPVTIIYTDYENWCASLRIKPYAVPEFGRKLHASVGGIQTMQKKFGTKEMTHWVGVKISEKAPTLASA